jgi:hypothetical protein
MSAGRGVVEEFWARPGWVQALFALGALGVVVHLLDEGRSAGEFDPLPASLLVGLIVLTALYPRLGGRWRGVLAVVALGLGIAHTIGGSLHLRSLLRDPQPADATGPVELLGALLLLALALGTAVRLVRAGRPPG